MDFDYVDTDIINDLNINKNCLNIIKTKNGFHLLVELSKIDNIYKKTWYNDILKLPGVDVRGDCLVPVPGTIQGNFTPKLIKVN